MSKEYRNEFRKDTIGENVTQETFSVKDSTFGTRISGPYRLLYGS